MSTRLRAEHGETETNSARNEQLLRLRRYKLRASLVALRWVTDVRCPFCSRLDSKVIDSRTSIAGDVIRRRRECEGCGRRFTSRERVEDVLPVVVKKDGAREPFAPEKVLRTIPLASHKRPLAIDPIAPSAAELQPQ